MQEIIFNVRGWENLEHLSELLTVGLEAAPPGPTWTPSPSRETDPRLSWDVAL